MRHGHLRQPDQEPPAQAAAALAEAWAQLAEHGAGGISLRGIPRQLGTASSALFRYFPSHNDLITALVADPLGPPCRGCHRGGGIPAPADHTGRWLAICQAHRD